MKHDMFEKITHRPEGWHEHQSMDDIEQWAARLLRRHHATVRNAVERQFKPRSMATTVHNGAIDDVLEALDKLAGKRGKA